MSWKIIMTKIITEYATKKEAEREINKLKKSNKNNKINYELWEVPNGR